MAGGGKAWFLSDLVQGLLVAGRGQRTLKFGAVLPGLYTFISTYIYTYIYVQARKATFQFKYINFAQAL